MSREFYLTNTELETITHKPDLEGLTYEEAIEEAQVKPVQESALHLYGRDPETGEEREAIVEGYHPYFFAPTGHGVSVRDHSGIIRIDSGYTSLFGDDLDKVTVRSQWDIKEARGLFPRTFASDVWYTTRARVDLGLYSGVRLPEGKTRVSVEDVEPADVDGELRTLTVDIETDDRGAFPKPGEKRILSIAAHDSFTDELVVFFDLAGRKISETFPDGKPEGCDRVVCEARERDMLKRFTDYVADVNPDVITAWNVDFDVPYIIARMDEIGVDAARLARDGRAYVKDKGDAVIGGRAVYDLLYAYKSTKRGELESYRLDYVAEVELGERKIDHTGVGFYEMYCDDPDKFVRYNARDVDLAVRINEEAGVFAFKKALKDEVGVDFDETKDNHQLIEMFARRKLHEKGLVGPDARHDHPEDEYEGAYVFEPFRGVAKNVAGVDLSSLYPMTMKMFNMSPETVISDEQATELPHATAPGTGIKFRLDKKGIFAELVDDAIALKSDYKEQREALDPESEAYAKMDERYLAAKTITNSIYGVLGWVHFFLYDRRVAESVTLAGQACIKETQRFISDETIGAVVYGDTDSNYVKFPDDLTVEEVVTEAKAVCTELNERVYPELGTEYGVPRDACAWEIELEAVARRFFQHGKKKRYAQHIVWTEGKTVDKVKIVGYHRSDVPAMTQDLLKQVLETIVRTGDEHEIANLVYEAAGEIDADGSNLDRIGVPGGLGKSLTQYTQKNGKPRDAHPRAAYNANALLGKHYGAGDKPKRVYLRPTGTDIGEIDVIAFDVADEVPEELRRVDATRMTDVAIVNPLGEILDAAGVDVHAAVKGQHQTGLSAFM